MILPGSYASGFAPRDGMPLYPELWRGCTFAAAPMLGPTGLTLRDWSGFGNHGTLTNMDAGTDWVISNRRYALDFVTDDTITIPYRQLTMPFTVSAWAMSRSATAVQNIWSIGNSADIDQLFNLTFRGDLSGDPVVAQMRGNDPFINTTSNSLTGYSTGVWYHIAAVFRSTTYRRVYLNGIGGTADTTSYTFETFDLMTLGALRRTTTSGYLDGQIAQVEIYAEDMSESKIRMLGSRPGIAYEMAPRRRSRVSVLASLRYNIFTGNVGSLEVIGAS